MGSAFLEYGQIFQDVEIGHCLSGVSQVERYPGRPLCLDYD